MSPLGAKHLRCQGGVELIGSSAFASQRRERSRLNLSHGAGSAQWPGVRGAVAKPAGLAYLSDSGTKPLNTSNPLTCVTAKTPEKPGCWILHDPGDDAPNTGGVTSDDPNWGGPHPRHNGRSAIAFLDGHVASMKPSEWYWSLTPWLQPKKGGP